MWLNQSPINALRKRNGAIWLQLEKQNICYPGGAIILEYDFVNLWIPETSTR